MQNLYKHIFTLGDTYTKILHTLQQFVYYDQLCSGFGPPGTTLFETL